MLHDVPNSCCSASADFGFCGIRLLVASAGR